MHDFIQEEIERCLKLRTWAVVGASTDPERTSYRIVERLRDRGYQVLPVSPRYEEVLGLPCYPSITALPVRPDVVDMVVNPAIGLPILREIAAAGITHVWLQPGAESEALHRFGAERGIAVIDACVLVALSLHPDAGFSP